MSISTGEGAVEVRKRHLISERVGDLGSANLDPTEYIVQPYFPRGVVTLLGGHGGSGKTNLALIALAHVAAVMPLFGLPVKGAACAFISLEDDRGRVRHKLRMIAEAYGIDADSLQDVVLADGSHGDPSLASEEMADGVRRLIPTPAMEELRLVVKGCGFIVIDNASDGFDGDENNRRQVRSFIRMLTVIARENNAAVVVLAHVDKMAARQGSNGNSYSGSTAWHNSTRSRLALIEHKGVIELRHEKLNLGRKADPLELGWSEHGVLMQVASNPLKAPAKPTLEEDAAGIRAAILAATAAGQPVTSARVGRVTTFHALETFPELPRALRSKERFWAALAHLQSSKSITLQEYTTDQRKKARKWVVAPNAPKEDSAHLEHSAQVRIGPAPNALNARRGVKGGVKRAHSARIHLPTQIESTAAHRTPT